MDKVECFKNKVFSPYKNLKRNKKYTQKKKQKFPIDV